MYIRTRTHAIYYDIYLRPIYLYTVRPLCMYNNNNNNNMYL